jgi:hypothetical protein
MALSIMEGVYFFMRYVVKLVVIEKSRVEDERKVEELTQKLEEAIALRQEAEAKLAHAEKKLCELEHNTEKIKVSQFCSYHHIINVICISCMFILILHPVVVLTNCGSMERLCACVCVCVCVSSCVQLGVHAHHHHHCMSMLRSVHVIVDWCCTELRLVSTMCVCE